MTVLRENGVLHKLWYFLRTYILTLARFDLFLQGSLLIVILLESNVFLLMRRDHGGGHTPAYIEDWIMISAGGAEFLFGALVAWWGRHKRNFALSVWLGIAALSGFLVLFVPFAQERSPNVELCGGEPINYRYTEVVRSDETRKGIRLGFLIFSAVICSLTKVSIWAHGFTYLDDHEPQNGPYFYGILISIRLSLGLSGHNWLQPSSMGNDWWKSQLSISCLTLMFAVLFTLFPTQMKEFPDDEQDRTVSGSGLLCNIPGDQNGCGGSQHATNKQQNPTDYFPSLERIARNKALVLQTIAIALLTTAVFGFIHYDRAYVQARFHVEAFRQDPRTSRALSDIFRSLVIIFFVMIFRVRFSVRRCDGVKANTASRVGGVVAFIVAVFLAVIATLSCDVGNLEGAGSTYLQPSCSQQCGCDSARYGFSPVCGLETSTTYFSPCHAGCQEMRDLNGFSLFHNCTCGGQQAVRGACSISDCRAVFSAYQVLYTVFLAVAAASLLMQGMAVARAVRRADKPVAVGASLSAVALLSYVGGHVVYMAISYFTCAYYEGGRCVLHRESLWASCCMSAVLALSSAGVSLLASRSHAHPPVPTTEL